MINGRSNSPPVFAFAESQIVEIFPKKRGKIRILNKIYGDSKLCVRGAPNNGPNESLAFLNFVFMADGNHVEAVTVGTGLLDRPGRNNHKGIRPAGVWRNIGLPYLGETLRVIEVMSHEFGMSHGI